MIKTAVFPGSFDPITKGHESIVKRALPLFDEVVVAIGMNASKNHFFSLEKRKAWIEQVFASEPKVKVETYEGLTVDFCKTINANYILRGLRTSADFEFERTIAQMNYAMDNGIETVFIVSTPELSAINSTIVRDILRHGGDAIPFVPDGIELT
ncbi:MAG: pantetheine-phosphate adenylyltransferase [Flavobacteriales bacterium]|nr:MAG: pantetheine-phosphate adenylyltransferase [Flavobacteriales bacterium]